MKIARLEVVLFIVAFLTAAAPPAYELILTIDGRDRRVQKTLDSESGGGVQNVGTYEYMPTFWENRDLSMKSATVKRVLKIADEAGVLRPRDLDNHGIPRRYLSMLCRQGLLVEGFGSDHAK